MSKNTANTETSSTTGKKPRAPRKVKTAEHPAAAAPDAAPKTPAAGNTVSTLTKYAILGCAVIVTLPPAWKFNVPDRKPYYQIEVKDTQGNRYSDTYRITDKARAKTLAETIAKDRGIPLKVFEIVDKPAPEPTGPTQQMLDGSLEPWTPNDDVQDLEPEDPGEFADPTPF